MLHAKMIGHQVDDQLHAPCVQRVGKMAVIVQRSEVRIDSVEIGGRIAVIGLGHCAVRCDGRGPQRCDAQLVQIIQMLLDAGQVAAMPSARRGAVVIRAGSLAGFPSAKRSVMMR